MVDSESSSTYQEKQSSSHFDFPIVTAPPHTSPSKPLKKQLQQADDYHKLKQYYYDRYMSQLRDKILEHEHKIPSSSRRSSQANSINKVKLDPIQRKKGSNVKGPVNKPVKLTIPKSRRLNMLEAEDKLRKAGLLTNEVEVDEFRNKVATIDNLDEYVDDCIASQRKSGKRSERSAASRRPLSQITESRELSAKSRPSTKTTKQMNAVLNPHEGNRSMKPSDIAKAAAAALEKHCPRMDIPDLYCLRDDDDDSDNNSEVGREERRQKKRQNYFKHINDLRKMYQHSQINTAQSHRIIDSREDDVLREDRKDIVLANLSELFEQMQSKLHLSDTESVSSQTSMSRGWLPPYNLQYLQAPEEPLANLSDDEADRNSGELLSLTQEDALMRWREETQVDARQQINLFTPIQEEPDTPVPLSLGALETNRLMAPSESQALVLHKQASLTEQELSAPMLAIEDGSKYQDYLNIDEATSQLKILESKALSSYWPNYLKVGKSKFARSS